MTYYECPQCTDDVAVRVGDNTVECRSCRAPYSLDWLTDDWTIFDDWSEVP